MICTFYSSSLGHKLNYPTNNQSRPEVSRQQNCWISSSFKMYQKKHPRRATYERSIKIQASCSRSLNFLHLFHRRPPSTSSSITYPPVVRNSSGKTFLRPFGRAFMVHYPWNGCVCVCRWFVPLPSSSFLHYPGYVGPDLCPVASDFTWRRWFCV